MISRVRPELLGLAVVLGLLCTSPSNAAERPSVLLLVVDTLRASAVSAYGDADGTTPELDALAREGILYRRAYAPAPWTLPSHATILSGLRIDQHRVSMPGRNMLPEDILTLAERMQAAGYETAAFSENPVVSDLMQLLQGFEHRRTGNDANGRKIEMDAAREVERWVASRDVERPYFVFVNLLDPHAPYVVRSENPFVPSSADRNEIANRPENIKGLICGAVPDARQLAILKGLYLGDVHQADAKVGRILRALRRHAPQSRLLTIATSDHGEYFGEDKLMGHQFGLHAAVLHVPMIVHGLPGVSPAAIDKTVGLEDIAPSILEWTAVDDEASGLGQPLPRRQGDAGATERIVFSAYVDASHWLQIPWLTYAEGREGAKRARNRKRQFCGPSDRVFGPMASIIRYPFKLRWYERYPPELYDLRWQSGERSNRARYEPEQVKQLSELIEPYLHGVGLKGEPARDPQELPEEALEALRELGYLE